MGYVQDYKDESGLQSIKFHFLKSKKAFRPLFFLVTFFVFLFQDNKVTLKQIPGHNHENTIYQQGYYPVKYMPIHLMDSVRDIADFFSLPFAKY